MNESAHPYQHLTPDLVLDAVESCGFEVNGRLFPLNSYENRVYQVGIENDTPLIAKFYRPERWSREQLLEEHSFVAELEEAEIPVVGAIKLANGGYLADYGGFTSPSFRSGAARHRTSPCPTPSSVSASGSAASTRSVPAVISSHARALTRLRPSSAATVSCLRVVSFPTIFSTPTRA